MASGFVVKPLATHGGLNWIFLIEILVCGILAVFFLFYFNRLFATVISYIIRAWTWHKYRAYIDITSLQISLLGGRVFFKSIRYHAHNVTCLVHEGHITWRYWLRQVQDAEVFETEDVERKRKKSGSKSEEDAKSSSDDQLNEKQRSRSVGKEENAGQKPKKELPCRISVKVSGVEAFVYNRSPVYDSVYEQTKKKAQRSPPKSSSGEEEGLRSSESPDSGNDSSEKKHRFAFRDGRAKTEDTIESANTEKQSHANEPKKLEPPAFLHLFPVRIECRKAAATLGNENTTNVIVAKVERAVGTVDAGHAGPLDLYKLLFRFDLEKCTAVMKPNRDFKQLQLDAARRILREKETETPVTKRFNFVLFQKLRKRWQSLFEKMPRKQSTARSIRTASMKSEIDGSQLDGTDRAPMLGQWSGLDRYMEEKEVGEHDEWKDVEYAKASTLADINKLHMNFYFDMPGQVTEATFDAGIAADPEDIPESKPPDYGMEFAIYGGVVTYGPWADRQRLNLQQIFFPAAYVDAEPLPPPKPGDYRNWTEFKIFISIEEDVTLRIPSREPSKDSKWQGRGKKFDPNEARGKEAPKRKGKRGMMHRHMRSRCGTQGNPGVDARPYGWLDIVVKTDTTVSYTMDMFPRLDGYRNNLDVDCKSTEILSSVNHGLLWKTGQISVLADLSQPIQWNTLRKWPFDITINDMELFILRDHLFLIIDLVNDWSYGPPVNFYTFVPYIYSMRLLFRNFIMYLNVNDANIVNDPTDFDKNDILTLEGVLDSTLNINMDQFRPVRNMITFDVLATNLRMRMLSPSKSSISLLLKDKLVADLPKLTLYGSYSGHIEERPGLVDALRFDIVGTGLTLKAYGFLVRQLINVKENYFGDYLHFKTLEEFQGADDDLAVANIKTASLPKPKFINELDVMLCIVAEDVTVLLPTNMYSADEFIRAEVPLFNLDLRIVSYYLDMGLQLSPITFLSDSLSTEDKSSVETVSQPQLFVKHMNLDGHRAFGLPPDEPAYINQWNIDIGAMTGELSSSFVHDLAMGGRAFIFGFQDRENALPLPAPSIFFDATFVHVQTDLLRLWFAVGKDALLLSLEPVEVTTNDWASDTLSQRVSVVAPKLTIACVDAQNAPRQNTRSDERTLAKTYAFIQTGAAVNVLVRKPDFGSEMRKQQAYIRENDLRTERAPFLLRQRDLRAGHGADPEYYPPTMPYPFLPPPLDHDGQPRLRPASVKSIPSFTGPKELRHKASSSSLSTSIRASPAAKPNASTQKKEEQSNGLTTSSRTPYSASPLSSASSSIRERTPRTQRQRGEIGSLLPNATFSSSFAEPYFPLDTLRPDESDVPQLESVPEADTADPAEDPNDAASEVLDALEIDNSAAQTSVMIQISPGLRAYIEPRVVATASKLFRKVLPKQPEEVMDAFHMDVMGAVAAKQQAENGTNSTLEIQASLPTAQLRIVNPGKDRETNDQLDISLRSIDTLVRVRDLPSSNVVKEVLAVHASMGGLSAQLGRPETLKTSGPAVETHIDDVVVWVATAAARSIHARVEDTIVSVAAEHSEAIVDFVIRLLPCITDLKAKVEAPLELHRNRLLMLTHTLTQRNDEIGDPAYLSRITYILRAFPEHFRNQESWKVVSRFRHILNNLPKNVYQDLKTKLKKAEPDWELGAAAKALDQWAQWQNWDVPNVHQTVAF